MPVELFRAGELELDCYKIDLVQGTHESPFSMHGRGFIGQNADGHITFKVYPTEIVNPPAAGDDGLAGEEGKLIPSGRNWCQFIFPWEDVRASDGQALRGKRWTCIEAVIF
jgi:hypothetical protein